MTAARRAVVAVDTRAAVTVRLVSVGFLYPDAVVRERFRSLLAEGRRLGALPSAELEALETLWSGRSADDMESAHFRLFGPAGDCPLDLAHHLAGNPFGQARHLADLAGFYEAFGVRAGERADNLSALLELLGLLDLKRGLAAAEGWDERREVADGAKRRLAAVILPGVRKVAASLQARDQDGFYHRLAALAVRVVAAMAGGKEFLIGGNL